MVNIDGIRIGVLGTSVDDPADDSNPNWTTGGPAGGRNALSTDERIITRAINALDSSLDDVENATTGFDARFNDVVGEETGADQTAFDAFGKNLIQVLTDLKSDEPPDDDLLYARSRATGATAGTWEEIISGGAMPEPPDDDLLYARSRATGATAGTWEEIISGGAMPEPPDDDLLYARSRATGATAGTWEEISVGGIRIQVGLTLPPAPNDPNDVFVSTAGQGLWVYTTGPGWVQRITSGTQGPIGPTGPSGPTGPAGTSVTILGNYPTEAALRAAHATGNLGDAYLVLGDLWVWSPGPPPDWQNVGEIRGPIGPTGAVEGITIASAVNPSSPSPGHLWTRPDGSVYVFTAVPGGWFPVFIPS